MRPIHQQLLLPRVITGAIMMSVLIYFVVLGSLSVQWNEPAPDQGPLPMVLMALSIGMIPVIAVARKVVMGSVAIIAPPMARSSQEVSPADLDIAIGKAAARYMSGTVVGLALSESIAIFGLVTAFLTQDHTAFVPNAVVALVLMAIQFPRKAGLLNLLGEPERAAMEARG